MLTLLQGTFSIFPSRHLCTPGGLVGDVRGRGSDQDSRGLRQYQTTHVSQRVNEVSQTEKAGKLSVEGGGLWGPGGEGGWPGPGSGRAGL